MNPWYVVTTVLFAAWVGGMAYWLRPAKGRHAGPPPERESVTALLPGHVLVPAPRIGRFTLRNWLVHYCHREGVWSEVVAEFYTTAAADPEIAAHFRHTDMERLQRHFLSALLMLTNTGLTVGALDVMRTKHSGRDITGPVFDRTILALARVLESKGVPSAAIEQLLPAVDLLRGAIVATPVP